jgi:hypothetical protein
MADSNKRVTFTGVDNGVESMMQRLRASAETTTRDLIRQARNYSTSGKEVVQYIEEEIRAIEKRNKTYAAAQQLQLQQEKSVAMSKAKDDKGRAAVTKEFAGKAQALSLELKEDKMQLDLMRELIDTVRSSAKQQISEDRKGVEAQLDANENLSQRGLAENADEMDELRQTVQRQAMGDEDETAKKEDDAYRRSRGQKVEQIANRTAQVAGSDNEIYMLASLAAMIPLVGQGVSMLAQKFMQKGEELDRATGALSAISGQTLGPTMSEAGDWTEGIGYNKSKNYGKTQAEFMQGYVIPLVRAQGTAKTSEQEALFGLQAERGLGLDMGAQAAAARSGRNDTTYSNNEERIRGIMGAFSSSLLPGEDMSMLPELLEINNRLTQEQSAHLGKIDSGINVRLAAGIANVSSFKDPSTIANMVSAMDAATRTPANQYTQATQYSVMRQLNPNASLWDLKMMQDEGIQDPRVLSGLLGRAKSATGDNKDRFMLEAQAIMPGMSPKQINEIAGYYFKHGKLPSDGGRSGIDVAAKAYANTGTMERQTADLDEWFGRKGKMANDYLENKMEDFGKVTEAFSNGLFSGVSALGTFTKGLLDFESALGGKNNNGVVK